MNTIVFDYEKLNRDDKKIYDAMTSTEKQNFEKLWVSIETQKAKLLQQKNRSKERNRREQKVLSEKQRKERTHRLIERGAILESFIDYPENYSNDGIMAFLKVLFSDSSIKSSAEQYRHYTEPKQEEQKETEDLEASL